MGKHNVPLSPVSPIGAERSFAEYARTHKATVISIPRKPVGSGKPSTVNVRANRRQSGEYKMTTNQAYTLQHSGASFFPPQHKIAAPPPPRHVNVVPTQRLPEYPQMTSKEEYLLHVAHGGIDYRYQEPYLNSNKDKSRAAQLEAEYAKSQRQYQVELERQKMVRHNEAREQQRQTAREQQRADDEAARQRAAAAQAAHRPAPAQQTYPQPVHRQPTPPRSSGGGGCFGSKKHVAREAASRPVQVNSSAKGAQRKASMPKGKRSKAGKPLKSKMSW